MTIVGPYSLGIINALAHTTHELQGNWINSKVTRLEGHFSALIKVTIDDAKVDTLKANLAKEFPLLEFIYDEIKEFADTEMKDLVLELDCADRPAIIRDIHELLSNFELCIEGMESRRYEVLAAGKSVFSTKLQLKIPQDTDTDALIEELGTIAGDVRIHIV